MNEAKIGVMDNKGLIISIDVDTRGDKLKKVLNESYTELNKVLNLIRKGNAYYVGHSLDCPPVVSEFGLYFSYDDRFNNLTQELQQQFEEDFWSSDFSVFKNRDLKLDEEIKYSRDSSLKNWLLMPKERQYLFHKGKWYYYFRGKPQGTGHRNLIEEKEYVYHKYLRKHAEKHARILQQQAKNNPTPNFHGILRIHKYNTELDLIQGIQEQIEEDVLAEDYNGVVAIKIPTSVFYKKDTKGNWKPQTLKYITDFLYQQGQNGILLLKAVIKNHDLYQG